MALYSKEDFAKACGVSSGYIAMYIKRGKIIVENEMINDKNRDNATFMKQRLDKVRAKNLEGKAVINDLVPEEKGKSVPLDQNHADSYDLGLKKKAIDIEKAEAEVRLLVIKEEKMRGELIPVDIVKAVLAQYSQSIQTEMRNFIENFIVIIAKRKELSIAEVAEIRGESISAINESNTKAVYGAKKSISNTVKEYSASKGVGEHE